MGVEFNCPKCQRVLDSDDRAESDRVVCSGCGVRIKVKVPASLPAPRPQVARRYVPPDEAAAGPDGGGFEVVSDAPVASTGGYEMIDDLGPPREDVPPRRRRKSAKSPPRSRASRLAKPLVGAVVGLVALAACGGLTHLAATALFGGPDLIPAEYWQEQSLDDRFAVPLPGSPNVTSQKITGDVSMTMLLVSPDKETFYMAAHSVGRFPVERAALPAEVILNDSCDGSRETLRQQDPDVKELSRTSVSFEGFPGKELVLKVPAGDGRVVSRIYLVEGQLFILSVGGRGISADNANVKYLFDSLKAVPPSERKPERKPEAKAEVVVAPAPDADPTLPKVALRFALPPGVPDDKVVALGFSPDGDTLAVATSYERASWYDARTGKLRETRSIGSKAGNATATVSAQGDRVAFYRHGGQLYYWERGEKAEAVLSPGGPDGLPQWKAAFAPDGRTLCTAHGDRVARLWDLPLGRVRVELKPFAGHVGSAAYSPDGRLLACADTQVSVWDAETLRKLGTLEPPGDSQFTELRFSPDGSTLAAVRDRTITVWDLERDLEAETVVAAVRVIKGVEVVRGLAFSADGKCFAAPIDGRRVRVWDAKTLKRRGDLNVTSLGNPTALAFRPTDSRLAVACGESILLLDLDAQKWD